ncbi:hypothetical protein J8I29_28155 [Labrys sp. LIt4]|uniref:ankyrin repeat domain-containing protein n=1 Tax=Labrys sp. LIt4 TaxID=2821355 RepID=UPI001AE005CE|nr:ankyrin repeat domain-containing protein [Labrys sp. LIt4]MBP0583233.1 hypothetical protein [Labrys sp. LIt4]
MDIFAKLRTDVDFNLSQVDDVNIIDQSGCTLLQEAISYRPEFANAFIEAGVNLNNQDKNGQTALQYSIAKGLYDISDNIIAAGCDLELIDKYGNGPLWTAVLNPKPNYELIRKLIELGADKFHKNNAGKSPYDMAIVKGFPEMLSVFGA